MSAFQSPKATNSRRGQTLAEFALTLPILLILIFGIIEFGRAFQAWVTLQNAARSAARYASVGAINWELFEVPDGTLPLDQRVLNAIVPCVGADERGDIATQIEGVDVYRDGTESLFATWYDGVDCNPENEDHNQLRRDILRLISIMREVQDAGNSLALNPAMYGYSLAAVTPDDAGDILESLWAEPFPGQQDEGGHAFIGICSSRGFLNPDSTAASASFQGQRYITLRNNVDQALAGTIATSQGYPLPFCMLNELPPIVTPQGLPLAGVLQNAGFRWMDPGGPGERVTVMVRFNHPLITPLRLAAYVTMEARRSTVNESFRPPKAVGAFQRSVPIGQDPQNTPSASLTPSITFTPSNTPIATDTPTNTPSATLDAFSCANLNVVWSSSPFVGNQLFMSVQNTNSAATELNYARIGWTPSNSFPEMYAAAFSLNNVVHWRGTTASSPPQILVDTRTDGTFYDGLAGRPSSFRIVPGRSSAVWAAAYLNGPQNLGTEFSLNSYSAEFEFSNPNGSPCVIALTQPFVPEPTETLEPTIGPSPTRTPDCATNQQISVRFGLFDTFDGSVSFIITNGSQVNTFLLGFALVWPDPTHPAITANPGDYFLRQVTVGGDSPSDAFTQQVWASTGPGEDATGNINNDPPYQYGTVSSNAAEGSWVVNAILRPGETAVYFDFDGFAGRLTQFGVARHHFDQSILYIGCTTSGGTGGPGGPPPTGVVGINEPSPTTTATRRPSSTPRPTSTASPITPTTVPTTRPTDVPVTPSNTPVFTNTPPNTPIGGFTGTPGGNND